MQVIRQSKGLSGFNPLSLAPGKGRVGVADIYFNGFLSMMASTLGSQADGCFPRLLAGGQREVDQCVTGLLESYTLSCLSVNPDIL